MRRAATVVAKTLARMLGWRPRSLLLHGSEVALQLGELGPLLGIVLPAALHHLVHVLRASLRARHPVTWRGGGSRGTEWRGAGHHATEHKVFLLGKSATQTPINTCARCFFIFFLSFFLVYLFPPALGPADWSSQGKDTPQG